MNRTGTFSIAAMLLVTASGAAFASAQAPPGWTRAALLAALTERPTELSAEPPTEPLTELSAAAAEWPALDSRSVSCEQRDQVGDQVGDQDGERARARASVLLEGLAALLPELSSQPNDEFARTVSGLLGLRQRVGAKAGYVNALCADSIDRTLVVALAERLVNERAVSPAVADGVAALRGRTLDLDEFAEVVRRERGSVPRLLGTPLERFDALVLAVFGPGGFERFASNALLAEQETFRLLDRPDLGSLLFRLWTTDRVTHLGLPLLAELYAREPGFDASAEPEARYEQVRRVLTLDERERARYGSPFHAASATVSYDVAELLSAAMSGEIRTIATFNTRTSHARAPSLDRAADPGDGKR